MKINTIFLHSKGLVGPILAFNLTQLDTCCKTHFCKHLNLIILLKLYFERAFKSIEDRVKPKLRNKKIQNKIKMLIEKESISLF